MSRDKRRLAEKIETAYKLAEMVDSSLLCYCDGGADGNGANGVRQALDRKSAISNFFAPPKKSKVNTNVLATLRPVL
eukprot:COSAG01_NODE_21335_length_906_cov_5.484511_2_plen_77_part_00